MKVAILSDIHANYEALMAVVEDIEKNNCEKVLCLGDLAMAGPEPKKALDYIQKQNNWTIIQGNTDKLITDFSEDLYNDVLAKFPVMAYALADDVKVLDNEEKEYLKNLPAQMELDIEGVKVLLVHGSPRRNNEDILPNLSIEKVEEIIKDVNANLIFCGHTHIPCGYQTNNKKTVVNVGSVGRPMTDNPQACYAIANFESGAFTIEHRFVDYDREKTSAKMLERGFKGSETLSQMILNPNSDKRHG